MAQPNQPTTTHDGFGGEGIGMPAGDDLPTPTRERARDHVRRRGKRVTVPA